MFKWLGILLYIIFFLLFMVCENMALNITRGETDKFTNPRFDIGTSINCDSHYGASCVTPKCFECRCDANNPTFYQNEYSDGKCVKNEKFSVSLVDSQSFLANNKHSSHCMEPIPGVVPDLTVDICDVNDIKQHWIWTKHNQILNLHTLKCLQTSEIPVFRQKYPKVSLASCNASDSKQIWQCLGKNGLVYLKYENAYLNYGNVWTYVIVFSGTGAFSIWKRYQSDQPFCFSVSAYHGCYKYSDGSSIFTIKNYECDNSLDQCEEEKNISAPVEVTNDQCSIQWEMTEFLNYSQWNYLPGSVLGRKSFHLVKRNFTTISLKVNLATSQNLQGQIIRLYIRCESTSYPKRGKLMDQMTSIKQSENETHCVLVKFSGNFKFLFPIQVSEPFTTLYQLNKTTTHRNDDQTETSTSTVVIVITTCASVLVLFAAIILFFVFKQKRYPCCMKKAHETRNDLYERNSTQHASVKSAETLNPVYSCSNISPRSKGDQGLPVDAASSECVLYGTITNENVGYEADAMTTDSEHVYDYANPTNERNLK